MDLISRQEAIDALSHMMDTDGFRNGWAVSRANVDCMLRSLPSAQTEVIYCRECKHFELDHLEKIQGFPIPIIVAHEICTKWGRGCKTSSDGWCFMAERKEENEGSDQ